MEVIPDILELITDVAGNTIETRCGKQTFRYIYVFLLAGLYILDIVTAILWIVSIWQMMDVTPSSGLPPEKFFSFHNGTNYKDVRYRLCKRNELRFRSLLSNLKNDTIIRSLALAITLLQRSLH